jgi:hypothetical protein
MELRSCFLDPSLFGLIQESANAFYGLQELFNASIHKNQMAG